MTSEEFHSRRWGPSPSEGRLIGKGFTVEPCLSCQMSMLVVKGDVWQHDCQEGHQLLWLSATHVVCSGCHWQKDRPRIEGRWQSGYTVRTIWKAAHTPK